MQQEDKTIIDLHAKTVDTSTIQQQVTQVIYEYLYPNPPKNINQQLEMNLQNLEKHRKQPCNLQNVSITSSLLQKQVHEMDTNQLLIVDGSISKQIPDLFKKYYVAKGYQYTVENSNNEAFFDPEHLTKMIEYQFQLGQSGAKPCFIGELNICKMWQTMSKQQKQGISKIDKVLKTYVWFSKKTNCPIFMNLQTDYRNQTLTTQQGKQRYALIKELFEKLKIWKCESVIKNIILINPPISLKYVIKAPGNSLTIQNQLHQELQNLYKTGCKVCFQILKYCFNSSTFYMISQFAKKYAQQTILTGGAKFKTDLESFSGEGIFFRGILEQILKPNIGSKYILERCLKQNILDSLSWKRQKIIIKQKVYWKCDNCLGNFEEGVESFKKFGKQFCSIKCLKAHKF